MYRLLPTAVAVVCFAAALVVPATVSRDASPAEPLIRAPTPARPGDLAFEVGAETLHTTGGATALPGSTRRAVLDTVERYVELGSLQPIRTGRIGRGLERVFAPHAFAAAAGRDRSVLFDEQVLPDPAAAVRRSEVMLTGLARPDGEPAVVVARLALSVSLHGGTMRVDRHAELTLVPDGPRWVLDAYTVQVARPTALGGDPVPLRAEHLWQPDRPLFLLAIGSDERAGLVGRRADALHLVGVNAAQGKATILNFPRDTWVNVPGVGPSRINEGLNHGGWELQARTVTELTGVHPDVVLVTTFAGLPGMVEELGGLIVEVLQRHADALSGAFFEPGANFFRGHHALAFSRNRHIEGGDLTRTANQAHLIVAALAKLRGDGTSAADVAGYLGVLIRHASVHGVGLVDLFRFARVGLAVDPADVRNVTVPARGGFAGRASVVFPVAPAAEIFADLRDDAVLQHF